MPKETIETLVSELIHEEDWRRMRATAACVAGGPRSVQALIEALRSGPTELKKEAATMLARIKDPQAGVALVGLLEMTRRSSEKQGQRLLNRWQAFWIRILLARWSLCCRKLTREGCERS